MKVRAALATALLGLTMTACTSEGKAASGAPSPTSTTTPSATSATTTPTVATSSSRASFLPELFIGKDPADAVVVLKSRGWDVRVWTLKSDGTAMGLDQAGSSPLTVVNITKEETAGVAYIEVASVEPPPPVPAGPLTTVSEGTYLVGTDMVAGSYKSPGSSTGCYWARLKDDAGRNIIANDLVSGPGPARFTAKKGEYVKISLCTFMKI